jgi:hypothetical protein
MFIANSHELYFNSNQNNICLTHLILNDPIRSMICGPTKPGGCLADFHYKAWISAVNLQLKDLTNLHIIRGSLHMSNI